MAVKSTAAAADAAAVAAFAIDSFAALLHAHAVCLHAPLWSAVAKALACADTVTAGSALFRLSTPTSAAAIAALEVAEVAVGAAALVAAYGDAVIRSLQSLAPAALLFAGVGVRGSGGSAALCGVGSSRKLCACHD